jgi:hypothetical protein
LGVLNQEVKWLTDTDDRCQDFCRSGRGLKILIRGSVFEICDFSAKFERLWSIGRAIEFASALCRLTYKSKLVAYVEGLHSHNASMCQESFQLRFPQRNWPRSLGGSRLK